MNPLKLIFALNLKLNQAQIRSKSKNTRSRTSFTESCATQQLPSKTAIGFIQKCRQILEKKFNYQVEKAINYQPKMQSQLIQVTESSKLVKLPGNQRKLQSCFHNFYLRVLSILIRGLHTIQTGKIFTRGGTLKI